MTPQECNEICSAIPSEATYREAIVTYNLNKAKSITAGLSVLKAAYDEMVATMYWGDPALAAYMDNLIIERDELLAEALLICESPEDRI